jgi:membrane-bound lytic murein transglycosylase A
LLAATFVFASDMTGLANPILEKTSFSAIVGWTGAEHGRALEAFRPSCREILAEGRAFRRPSRFGGVRSDWIDVCERAVSARDPRSFFEQNFLPLKVNDPTRPEGLFTGYFEPEAEGSLKFGSRFAVPIYRKPDDLVAFDESSSTALRYGRLVAGDPRPFFTRREIEEGALAGRGLEVVWLADWADAFFMHVQGSGRVRLEDGSILRLAYAGKSGQPYTGIGGLLVERGILQREDMSMQAIRSWMADHPAEARALMWENKSFVFFREVTVEDPALGPPGAQKVPLTRLASLAVDRSLWTFGTPMFLDTSSPRAHDTGEETFRRLLIAQDTGTAIRGYARGDVFWGAGDDAAWIAGHMKSEGHMTALLPVPLAERLLAQQ